MRLYAFVFLLSVLLPLNESLLGGLKFHGGEKPIDQRTSYNVFGANSVSFSNKFDIEFNISLYPTTKIGYIIRIKNKKSNRIYNLHYDAQGDDYKFEFNEEGKDNLINASFDRKELINLHWFKMKLSFDLVNDSINLTIHNRKFEIGNVDLPNTYYPIVLFGKSDYIIDVPSFAIKELSIGNDEKYIFPLKESEGSIVYDKKGKAIGKVINPEWLINDSYHWRYKTSFKSKSVAGTNYNPRKKEFYYFNDDSIYIYNVRSGETEVKVFDKICPVKLILGTNFIDVKNDKLYSYEVYYEGPYDGSTVASLDLNTYKWTPETYEQLPTQLHHHGSFFDPDKKQYTIFGGFGSMHYSKNFVTYDIENKEWKTRNRFSGDFLSPRYFSSVGYLKEKNSVYIFGGMGNESGQQTVGRRYYYDLYKVDLNTNKITKCWQIPWNKDNVVPVRGMIVLNDSCFYTLCYPEHFSNSYLKLYRFSLIDGSNDVLGDSIPIHSDKITTNANLYYDDQLNNLYATVQEFDDDIASDLKIYSLAFPPITADEIKSYSKRGMNTAAIWIIILAGTSILGIVYLVYRKLRQHREASEAELAILHDDGKAKTITKPNSIYLFGDFMVRNRNNKDITYMFSAKLKQVFCLILQYSAEGGITSRRLSNILWPDRPAGNVKNSRGVTINNLRKALGELDGIELSYEKGCFKIVQTNEFYCDYIRCLELISDHDFEESREELIEIITRGKFLKLSDHELYDSFKEKMEQKLEPILLLEIEKSFHAKAYQTTIDLAEALFGIDPLNDTVLSYQIKAMQRLKMTDEATIKYQAFVIEYKNIMGTDFPHSLRSLS
ncbi:DNA-binding transcriptional activator [Prolixibacter sp. SD074]|uniref:Kelch repeat-containing protein n=1 Tax=Prolixibacter sp. SD074 TaxID=2652391 RepID=UPI00127B4200|nr:DNA-binding transcriptional activator [Prolixibacter sp. SD074]GET28037.1 hypothetical protein SD074_02390 [Prolixibacter sp. SD074]